MTRQRDSKLDSITARQTDIDIYLTKQTKKWVDYVTVVYIDRQLGKQTGRQGDSYLDSHMARHRNKQRDN